MNAIQGYIVPPHLVNELAMHLRKSCSMLTVAQAAAAAIRAFIADTSPRPPGSAQKSAQSAAQTPAQTPAQMPAQTPVQVLALAPCDDAPTRGYQWKSLFLPSGTELRMSTRDSMHYARVSGDDIIFRGRRVSPRGMTLAIAGDGRNAWRDLWLKLPGEHCFKPASRCRREHERIAAGLPANPLADSVTAKIATLASRATDASDNLGPCATEPAIEPAIAPPNLLANVLANEPANHAETIASAAATMSEALKTMLALMERISARAMPDAERRFNSARRHEDILAGDCAFD